MIEPSMCGGDVAFLSNYFNHLLLGRIAVQRTQTKPIATDQAVWSVSRSATVVSHAKMAELIEMPFGLRTRVDPRNSVLDGGPDPPWKEVILRSEGAAHYEVYGHSALSCAKMAELIEMPFGIWTQVGPRNHVSHGVQIPMQTGNFQGEGHARRHSAMGCVQTDEPIDMLFGLWAWVGSRNHKLNGGPGLPMRISNFAGKDMPRRARRHSPVNSAKMAKLIEMPGL